jgi:hypothetical protein
MNDRWGGLSSNFMNTIGSPTVVLFVVFQISLLLERACQLNIFCVCPTAHLYCGLIFDQINWAGLRVQRQVLNFLDFNGRNIALRVLRWSCRWVWNSLNKLGLIHDRLFIEHFLKAVKCLKWLVFGTHQAFPWVWVGAELIQLHFQDELQPLFFGLFHGGLIQIFAVLDVRTSRFYNFIFIRIFSRFLLLNLLR